MASCIIYSSSSVTVFGVSSSGSRKCHRRQTLGVVPSWAAIQSPAGGCDSCSSSAISLIFGRSSSLYASSRGGNRGVPRCGSRNVVCEVAVTVGDAQSSGEQGTTAGGGVQPGAKIRVKVPLTVYHVGKSPNLNLEGLQGEVKEVIGLYKGKTISANLPVKVQFVLEGDKKPVKFFAHLKDSEFEVVE